jgi:hypothetical protein
MLLDATQTTCATGASSVTVTVVAVTGVGAAIATGTVTATHARSHWQNTLMEGFQTQVTCVIHCVTVEPAETSVGAAHHKVVSSWDVMLTS